MTEYTTVKEIAERWGITPRLAQRYCTEGRIDGAVKFGGSWAIPTDAQKPTDPRYNKTETIKSEETPDVQAAIAAQNTNHTDDIKEKTFVSFKESELMPLMNTAFTPGHCMDSIIKIEDRDSRNIALAEYYYFSGKHEKASLIAEEYLVHDDLALALSACWIFGYASLALDKISHARRALTNVRNILDSMPEDVSPKNRALAVCVSIGTSVLLHLPLPEEMPPMKQFVHLLSPGFRLFALYVQAHQAYLNEQYGHSIGIVETALSLQGEVYPIPAIYLHLVATMDYMSLKDSQKAREHLMAAWELASPDDLIEAFGEHHGLLGGMLEAVIKKEYPEHFKRIIEITYSFSAGWRKIHNADTGHDVADDLTTTEFTVAMLAARGWSNKEIGAHMGISVNTVKQHISIALQKLDITQRKELSKFMLK